MRILFITTTFPTPARPRQGAFNQVLVSALSARHEVRVIAPIPWTQSGRNRDAVSCGGRTLHPTYYYPPKVLRWHHHRFYWKSIVGSIEKLQRRFTPDIVMGYFLHPDGAAAVLAAERFGVPSVVISGGTDLRLLPRQRGRRSAVKRVIERADRLVVVSHELAKHAYQLGVSADKVDVVYRGIDRGCFHPLQRSKARAACGVPTDAVALLWAGRLEEIKNPGMLLRAAVLWKRIWGDRLRVIVAGNGSLLGPLRQLCNTLELNDVVLFAGNLTQQELALRYNAADVTVLTSHSEGVPNVLLESIVCGTSFVATDVGGVSEIAAPGIDRLVPDNDVEAFANAVIQQVQTGPLGDQRAFVPASSVGMAAQIDAVIKRAVTGRQPVARNSTFVPGPMHTLSQSHRTFHEAGQ
jgi:teichuronic acid biosynthesis glycosyltransferase TuaC